MKKLFPLFALVLLFACTKSHQLELNLEKGKSYHQNLKSVMHLKQEINGQAMDITVNMNANLAFDIQEATDESYTAKVHYNKMNLAMETPMGQTEFKSEANESSPIMDKIMKKFTENSFIVELNKNGTVKSVSGMDALINSLLTDLDSVPPIQINQIKSQLNEAFGEDALKSNIEMMTAIFPNTPVKVDDTWTSNITLKTAFKSSIENQFTLVEYNDNEAVLEGMANISSKQTEPQQLNGMNATFDLAGTMKSTITIDTKSGWISNASVQQDIKGDVDVEANALMPNGMQIPMSVITDITITD